MTCCAHACWTFHLAIREVTESDIGCESAGWLWRHLSLSFAGCLLLRQWTLLPIWLHLWWFRNVQVWRCDLSISNKDPQFAQQGLWYRVSWLVYMSWWHDLLSHGWRNIRVLSIPSGKYLECHISPILLLHVCYAISDMPFVSICFVKQVHVRCDNKWILPMWIIPRDVLVGIISRPKSTATEIWNYTQLTKSLVTCLLNFPSGNQRGHWEWHWMWVGWMVVTTLVIIICRLSAAPTMNTVAHMATPVMIQERAGLEMWPFHQQQRSSICTARSLI